MFRYVVLTIVVVASQTVLASATVRVTTPEPFTLSDRVDSGGSRVRLGANGALIASYNLDSPNSLSVVKDKTLLQPQIKVCNNGDETIIVKFENDGKSGHVTAYLDPGECAESDDHDTVVID